MFRFKLTSLIGMVLAAGVVSAPAAFAATDSATMNVSVTIDATCTVVTKTHIAFGSAFADEESTPEAQGELTVDCTEGAAYTVALTKSGDLQTAGGGVNGTIPFELYKDSNYQNAWDNGSNILNGTGTGGAVALPVYAKIPSTAGKKVGSYTATVTAVITY